MRLIGSRPSRAGNASASMPSRHVTRNGIRRIGTMRPKHMPPERNGARASACAEFAAQLFEHDRVFDRRVVLRARRAFGEAADGSRRRRSDGRVAAVARRREGVVEQAMQAPRPRLRADAGRRGACACRAASQRSAARRRALRRPGLRVRATARRRRCRRLRRSHSRAADGRARIRRCRRIAVRAVARAIGGVQAPARAGVLEPVLHAHRDRRLPGRSARRSRALRAGRARRRATSARSGSSSRRRNASATGALASGLVSAIVYGNLARAAERAAEHRFDVRRVRIDVGREHGDVARLQGRRFRRFQQRAQLVVQHLHFAQARVAGVELQAGVAHDRRAGAATRLRRCRAAAPRLSSTSACMRPSSVSRAGSTNGATSNAGDAISPPTSIATKSRPAWPHAASSGLGGGVACGRGRPSSVVGV